ncbi:hypothetical protein CC80DRAFT_429444 [Byssothecium circinans]|uniref:Exonuclease V n=1 Tax=Byssothecium circinans TaxID=147558 RepID=A0A6A5T8N9_9PLEO|nr:hypothetical protein CC80DRAFT_429444 [Byssothecium circinans]
MADAPAAVGKEAHSDYGSEVDLVSLRTASDYGSDIDPDDLDETTLVGDLLAHLAATAPKTAIYPSVEIQGALEGRDEGGTVQSPPHQALLRCARSSPLRSSTAVEFEYDSLSRRAFSVPRGEPPKESIERVERPQLPENDTRAPLERFRSRRPLSVTDLISPAWCELQYWYTLTKFGRKPPTQAMKAGTKIHQTLEEEVHTVVPVQVQTKEDRFGLRIWNIVQGLRTLRAMGQTRELEIWGVVEGQVVNGVIDELSFTCSDPELEEQLEISKAAKRGGTLPLGQLSVEQAFAKAAPTSGDDGWIGSPEPDRRVYITDVKTRGHRSVPKGVSLRPTWMQLMLYRKLLESLSLNTVDAETVFARYNVTPLQPFSEIFMLEAGAIAQDALQSGLGSPATQSSNELRLYPNLLSLWSLMISEFQQAIPSVSDILRAEFRFSKTGEVIGSDYTVFNPDAIDAYSRDEISWWKGRRNAKGVEVEEAFKCRICDFAEECTWRKTKIEEATEKHRLKRGAREKSAV